jgi:vacuolar protein sorting-associated protein 1
LNGRTKRPALTHSFLFSTAIEKQITEGREKALQGLKRILELERAPLFTQNDHDLEDARRKWLALYREACEDPSIYALAWPLPAKAPPTNSVSDEKDRAGFDGAKLDSQEQSALRSLADHGYRGIKREDLKRLHPHEDFKDELVVMADVRAYFQVAYKVRMNIPVLWVSRVLISHPSTEGHRLHSSHDRALA